METQPNRGADERSKMRWARHLNFGRVPWPYLRWLNPDWQGGCVVGPVWYKQAKSRPFPLEWENGFSVCSSFRPFPAFQCNQHFTTSVNYANISFCMQAKDFKQFDSFFNPFVLISTADFAARLNTLLDIFLEVVRVYFPPFLSFYPRPTSLWFDCGFA